MGGINRIETSCNPPRGSPSRSGASRSGAKHAKYAPIRVSNHFQPPLVQPWKAFWPPIPGTRAYEMLLKKHPEVLAWKFDITKPLERPWRSWAPGPHAPPCGDNAGVSESVGDDNPSREVQQERELLDQAVSIRDLAIVRPNGFNFLAPLRGYNYEKPYRCQLPGDCFEGYHMTNLAAKSYPVDVIEASGHEDLFSLAQSGFEFLKCPVRLDIWSQENVESQYIPALKDWLLKHVGAEEAFAYAVNLRQHGESDSVSSAKAKPSFSRAHCDATPLTRDARLKLYYPNDWETRLLGRVRLLNIWRPIVDAPVQNCPLAMCDFRTVNQNDLVPVDIVYPHFLDQAFEVRYNPRQRWFYKQGMGKDDVILFKLDDNDTSEATTCPHSAFLDPSVVGDVPRRASIEVKFIVFG